MVQLAGFYIYDILPNIFSECQYPLINYLTFDTEITVLERNVRIANATKRAKTLFRLGLEGKDPVVR